MSRPFRCDTDSDSDDNNDTIGVSRVIVDRKGDEPFVVSLTGYNRLDDMMLCNGIRSAKRGFGGIQWATPFDPVRTNARIVSHIICRQILSWSVTCPVLGCGSLVRMSPETVVRSYDTSGDDTSTFNVFDMFCAEHYLIIRNISCQGCGSGV